MRKIINRVLDLITIPVLMSCLVVMMFSQNVTVKFSFCIAAMIVSFMFLTFRILF